MLTNRTGFVIRQPLVDASPVEGVDTIGDSNFITSFKIRQANVAPTSVSSQIKQCLRFLFIPRVPGCNDEVI